MPNWLDEIAQRVANYNQAFVDHAPEDVRHLVATLRAVERLADEMHEYGTPSWAIKLRAIIERGGDA